MLTNDLTGDPRRLDLVLQSFLVTATYISLAILSCIGLEVSVGTFWKTLTSRFLSCLAMWAFLSGWPLPASRKS